MDHRTALPVHLDIADPALAEAVGRWVEHHLGWQVVADTPHLPARLVLADRPREGAVLLTTDQLDGVGQDGVGHDGPVVAWPHQADRLADLTPRAPRRPLAPTVVVGGAAGGVGTSTVALALAASSAWEGTATWLVAGAALRHAAGLGEGAVVDCPAAPGLSVTADPGLVAHRAGAGDLVVVDGGVHPSAAVLVARPDAALAAALATGPAGRLVVTVGDGGLRPAEVAALTDGHTHVHLRWDLRIARAGARGRLPGEFPGRWLRPLRGHLRAVAA